MEGMKNQQNLGRGSIMYSEPNNMKTVGQRIDQSTSFQNDQLQYGGNEVRGSVGGTMEDSLSQMNPHSQV